MKPSQQHPLNSIAGEHKPALLSAESADQNMEADNPPANKQPLSSVPAPPTLSPNSIQAPALLIDRRLCIVWQNRQAIDKIWHHADAAANGVQAPKLFDLLFDPQFQRQVDNWRRWTAFFIQQVQSMIPGEALQQWVSGMTGRQKDVISALMARHDLSSPQCTFSSRLRQVLSDGRTLTFGVVAVDFQEKRLLVFEPHPAGDDSGPRQRSYDIELRIENVRRHPNPVKLPFSIMAANLNAAVRLNFEMLSDEYSILINDVCQRSLETIERFGGVFNKHLDSGFCAYFLPLDEAEDNAMQVIECCLELKARIAELSREWKVRKSWTHDIQLNMGIHKAYEHMGTLSAYAGEMVASWGRALYVAANLSTLAQGGEIWATKSLFKEMQPDVYKQLRFGVMKTEGRRHPVFVQKCFSAITDLPGFKTSVFGTGGGLADIAVTQIFDHQV